MTMTAQGQANRTITAFFDKRETAADAVEKLVEAGFPRATVRLVAGTQPGSSTAKHQEGEGFWEALKDFFLPDEDRYTYAEGLRRGGYLVTVSTNETNYQRALDLLDGEGAVNIDERAESWRKEGWSGYASGVAGATRTSTGRTTSRTEQVVPVVEEQLKVGKRETGHGRVRVRSYVVQTPVAEQLNLTDEHVHVERHAVDRPARPGEGAFQERTIVAEETREEPVVSKQARVKEEVVVKKDAEERTQTVSGTVRRTEVKVEDERGNAVRQDKRKAS